MIIDYLLMRYSGFYGQEPPSEIYPPDYGDWKNMHRRFCRWRDKGVWEGLLEELISEPDFEWLMIDASHIKVHPHAAGAEGGNQDMGRTKGDSIARYTWPWMRMVCRSEYLLQAGITAMTVMPLLNKQKNKVWKRKFPAVKIAK